MTVKDLIELLSDVPPDTVVLGLDGQTPEVIVHETYVEII